MNGRWTSATRFLCVVALGLSVGLGAAYGANATPQYSIQAILFGTSPDVPVVELAMGGPKDVKIEIAVAIWLIRGGGHTILFDSGFHRDTLPSDSQRTTTQMRGIPTLRSTFVSTAIRTMSWLLITSLYLNLTSHRASATFSDSDRAANLAAQARMIKLAGSPDRILPGHDLLQFKRYPTVGRVAQIESCERTQVCSFW
jgi:hypothetical protein